MHKAVRWTAVASFAVLVVAGVLAWAGQRNEALRRFDTEQAAPVGDSHPLLQGEAVRQEPFANSAVSGSGRPMAGAKVYGLDSNGDKDLIGTTDAKGETPLGNRPGTVAVAPDGRIALFPQGNRFVFGTSASVRLHLSDGKGHPRVGQRISIAPAYGIRPIRMFGKVEPLSSPMQDLDARFSGETDRQGNVTFAWVPKDIWYDVTAHLEGNRTMRFEGAVRTGRRVDLVVAYDRQVMGRVVRGASSSPLAGAEVALVETNDGAYPRRVVQRAKTDAEGRYRFGKLLNCAYSIRLESPSKVTGPGFVESRADSGSWVPRGYDGPSWPGRETFADNMHTRLEPSRPVTTCDFRWWPSAKVTVELDSKGDRAVWVGRWAASMSGEGAASFLVTAGAHQVFVWEETPEGYRKIELGKVVARAGDDLRVRFKVPG